MIDIAADIGAAIASLDRLASELDLAMDAAIDAALADLIGRLADLTVEGDPDPRAGHMKEGYRAERHGPGFWGLLNEEDHALFRFVPTRAHAIPRAFGYPLPFGTEPDFHPGTSPDPALIEELDAAAADLESALRAAVERAVSRT